MQTVSYSVVVTKLSASVVAAIRLTSHAIKMGCFSGWAPKGVRGISKLVPAGNEFLVRRTYVKRD